MLISLLYIVSKLKRKNVSVSEIAIAF